MGIVENQLVFICGSSYDSEWGIFAFAKGGKGRHVFFANPDDVSLLGFATPNLHGRELRLGVGDVTQLKHTTAVTIVHQLGEGIAQATSAYVVNALNGVICSHRPAVVEDLLAASLHLWVRSLNGGKVEIFGLGARGQR